MKNETSEDRSCLIEKSGKDEKNKPRNSTSKFFLDKFDLKISHHFFYLSNKSFRNQLQTSLHFWLLSAIGCIPILCGSFNSQRL
jgi:hypothetical protein